VLTVNLKSVFNFTKAVQMTLIKKQSGSIINMSSVVGVGGNAGQANYAASKAGIIGFTKSVAQELGSRNIRCNAIAPGFIITEMTNKLPEEIKKQWEEKIPLKRGGTPEDVARVAIFLASGLSSYVNGQVINVCGGLRT
jgi:3-oxoacyl-[acyl-carrier protein] reductase